ncbi:hypothetical protein BURPS406E_G0680 [Burkholderia pseudomallei 406e]|nr:hypothetical protein BURPS406E_G0680 [Burkholderia pseudomallei 406e]EDO93583.1 hypothetical protein BURPSPAST_J0875 [Burkholderia pseudomallei Pasteur 52237]EDS83022.1 hypothetical protein BURPSS13_K0089 [Burkholderia pseudomallei S13]
MREERYAHVEHAGVRSKPRSDGRERLSQSPKQAGA